MNKRRYLLILIFSLILITGYSRERLRIAVINFRAKGVSRRVAAAVSDMIRTEMINIGRFIVIERQQMDKILREQGFQKTGCTDDECAVKLGRLMSARKMLVGTISRLGKEVIISGRVVDIERGTAEFGETETADSVRARDLQKAVKRFTQRLAQRITGVRVAEKEDVTPIKKRLTTGEIKTIGGIEFVYIEGGEFMMGSKSGDDNEKPVHNVYVDSFWMGKYEVTQKQYRTIMWKNPSRFKGKNRPVERVSWNDAMKFCRKFSRNYSVEIRLPYEAEWEYAARAGTATKYYWGDSMDGSYAGYYDNSGSKTHDVGTREPNKWGLYDMSGNVYEWCTDWYGKGYYNNSPGRNPKGPSSGVSRVLRGGSWSNSADFIRSATRDGNDPDNRGKDLGFRVVFSAGR